MISVFDASQRDWTEWLAESSAAIRSRVLMEGAVVVRGLALKNPADVVLARDALCVTLAGITSRGHGNVFSDRLLDKSVLPIEHIAKDDAEYCLEGQGVR